MDTILNILHTVQSTILSQWSRKKHTQASGTAFLGCFWPTRRHLPINTIKIAKHTTGFMLDLYCQMLNQSQKCYFSNVSGIICRYGPWDMKNGQLYLFAGMAV